MGEMAFADFGKYLLTNSYTLVIRYIMNIKTTYCCPFKVLLVLLCVLGGIAGRWSRMVEDTGMEHMT